MDLDEFLEELGQPLYERLVEEGYKTARDIIEAGMSDLLEIEGLTEEKVKELRAMMQRELAEADIEDDDEAESSVETAAEPAAQAEDDIGHVRECGRNKKQDL